MEKEPSSSREAVVHYTAKNSSVDGMERLGQVESCFGCVVVYILSSF